MEGERQHYNVTLGILTLAGTAFALQQTMVFPALGTFQEEFGAGTAWTTWVLTGFLVSAALGPAFSEVLVHFLEFGLHLAEFVLLYAATGTACIAWALGEFLRDILDL